MNDEEYIDKLINTSVIIKDKIPDKLNKIIENLERCNRVGNWIDYEMYESELETVCKNLILNGKLSEGIFNKLMKRYGRYV